jgi:hypothetical protein
MIDILPDGVTDIVDGVIDTDTIMLLPGDLHQGGESHRNDSRNITERRRTLTIESKQTEVVLDQLESGNLEYVLIKATRTLADGTEGALPGKIALFLQLDGFAQGGFESINDAAVGASVPGIKLSTMSELNLPEQTGMWYLTVDQTETMVALFRGKSYSHRIRLSIMNTDTTSSVNIDFVEIARRRNTANEGMSNQYGRKTDQLGY